ncbi:specificity protein S [Pseudomonas sp. RtIB026]|uniref:restriction endonuclease subunit S n=1 Tax=Pseudomonas sp. RtIB026 TaxID=2749999 RepID=UPI001944DE71|nr:restriction endonuclease subunit S [Pseudomonas sp. RtIB026]BCJ05007.1 specificity protein S [Pseudomonas sp. RtIB026]
MTSEWTFAPLEQCLDALIDYRGKTPEKTSSGIPLITAKIIKGGRVGKPTEFIATANYDSWMRRGIPKPGDVVLTVEAPLGEVAQLGPEKIALAQRVVTLRGKEGVLDNSYLLYLLQTEEMQEQLKSRATGTTVLGIKQSELRKVQLSLPPINQQKVAAQTLKALDDRIALLRETNTTLQAIAQALFKSWFVDFDPVHAKAEGLEPEGIDAATAELFPDGFEESELGLVPRGWSFGTLADLANLNPESWTARNRPEIVAYIDLANAKENVIAEITKYPFEDAPSRARRVLRDGDTIVGTVRPGNRSFAFIAKADANLTASTGFAVLRPTHVEGTEFVYLSATSDASIDYLTHIADGGAYPAVRPDVVSSLKSILPDSNVLRVFHDTAAPIFKKIAGNQQQAEALTQLRDTLLPRLISGQLRLPEAETTIENLLSEAV